MPAAPTPAATGSGADAHGSTWSGSTWSGAADESRAGDRAADPRPAQPSAAQPHITDQQAAEPQAAEPQAAEPQAAEPRAAGERDEEVDDPTAPTVPLPPPPPKPMTLAATQVINVLANAMRRPTSDYLEIFGKLQVIFDEDNWDPVTLALHLVHIISTGVLVGDGDEIDNLSWRLDRLPRSSAECECRSCLEQRGEKLGARPAPGTRRFARPGAGRSTGAGGGSKPATGSGQATRAADMDMSDPRPVEIPRPPLEAIERAAQAAREARARERAADGAA
ncbi:conserved hypothetical protein [Frankia canadensis]|uniref:Uncharacterized protein n=1 Tax=Frankia canadensis TaxID=1836972 RepID=A0A2I2KUY5_9ACTN|nr:conserved hypothetical protein [Frankia canadensis]SOU56773.1 conserved hypothetical protein [Frankia canadensis]